MTTRHDFSAIFKKLRAILKKYEKNNIVEKDTDTDYYLNSNRLDQKQKPVFFAATSVNKISVSFYLMPVHTFPDLLDGASPELRRHLHGKCCFRFTKLDATLLQELSMLTKRSAKRHTQDS